MIDRKSCAAIEIMNPLNDERVRASFRSSRLRSRSLRISFSCFSVSSVRESFCTDRATECRRMSGGTGLRRKSYAPCLSASMTESSGGEEARKMNGRKGYFFKRVFEELEPALPAHAEVRQDDELPPMPGEDPGRFRAPGGLQNGVAGLRQDRGVLRQIPRVRIDDEDGGGLHG